ncbi:MarR family transcriptional regulator [Conexibacter sp. JD483]|uniref:MarR family winged helix-turn-helix transcriptional regulator n=1 Tax=unclassified Conexibacter TaxID=2627773 RepID=UPI002725A64D|nr:MULTISPECIES: MarR family transcriptional regulator [unclassified Conexibacter]MDO8187245.1 MarR family transcriptional regulator [Conexibacter sp. CPCC 205706]MDO8199342.1 MarR family transcriptional regulator [Conexibacter sp. CPCC 205762]MDR9372981.1 MarR family transcriptional regulator [Conexibacter sp. JD483]
MRGVTFVLSQLGFHVSQRFGEAIAPLGLIPPHVGILQLVAREPGQSQQALSSKLGIPANRLVGLIDELEARELIRRERTPADRRAFALQLTPEGEQMTARVRALGAEHEAAILAPLSRAERDQLAAMLRRLADAEGLAPGIHPGLRKMR